MHKDYLLDATQIGGNTASNIGYYEASVMNEDIKRSLNYYEYMKQFIYFAVHLFQKFQNIIKQNKISIKNKNGNFTQIIWSPDFKKFEDTSFKTKEFNIVYDADCMDKRYMDASVGSEDEKKEMDDVISTINKEMDAMVVSENSEIVFIDSSGTETEEGFIEIYNIGEKIDSKGIVVINQINELSKKIDLLEKRRESVFRDMSIIANFKNIIDQQCLDASKALDDKIQIQQNIESTLLRASKILESKEKQLSTPVTKNGNNNNNPNNNNSSNTLEKKEKQSLTSSSSKKSKKKPFSNKISSSSSSNDSNSLKEQLPLPLSPTTGIGTQSLEKSLNIFPRSSIDSGVPLLIESPNEIKSNSSYFEVLFDLVCIREDASFKFEILSFPNNGAFIFNIVDVEMIQPKQKAGDQHFDLLMKSFKITSTCNQIDKSKKTPTKVTVVLKMIETNSPNKLFSTLILKPISVIPYDESTQIVIDKQEELKELKQVKFIENQEKSRVEQEIKTLTEIYQHQIIPIQLSIKEKTEKLDKYPVDLIMTIQEKQIKLDEDTKQLKELVEKEDKISSVYNGKIEKLKSILGEKIGNIRVLKDEQSRLSLELYNLEEKKVCDTVKEDKIVIQSNMIIPISHTGDNDDHLLFGTVQFCKAYNNYKNTRAIIKRIQRSKDNSYPPDMRTGAKNSINYTKQDANGNTVGHGSIGANKVNYYNGYLDYGGEVEKEKQNVITSAQDVKPGNPNQRNKQGQTPLHIASHFSIGYNFLQTILKKNGNPNVKDYFGQSVLHLAAEKGNSTLVIHLLRLFPNLVFKQNNHGLYPIHYSAIEETGKTIDIFIDYQIQLLRLNKNAPLFLRFQDSSGLTPLHWAASMGNVNICKKLITFGGCNQRDYEGETPIFKAVRSGNPDVFSFFQTLPSVDKTIINYNGMTIDSLLRYRILPKETNSFNSFKIIK